MNRVALFEQLVAVQGHLEVLTWFLANEPDDSKVRIEFEGRCDRIESRVAQIRGAVASQPSNVHVLGDRPPEVVQHIHVPPPDRGAA